MPPALGILEIPLVTYQSHPTKLPVWNIYFRSSYGVTDITWRCVQQCPVWWSLLQSWLTHQFNNTCETPNTYHMPMSRHFLPCRPLAEQQQCQQIWSSWRSSSQTGHQGTHSSWPCLWFLHLHNLQCGVYRFDLYGITTLVKTLNST